MTGSKAFHEVLSEFGGIYAASLLCVAILPFLLSKFVTVMLFHTPRAPIQQDPIPISANKQRSAGGKCRCFHDERVYNLSGRMESGEVQLPIISTL